MKHIKNINEFNSYTDDAAANVPFELLNIGDNSDKIDDDITSNLLSLSPKLKSIVIHSMKSGNLEKEDIDDICSTLNKDEVNKLSEILVQLSDVFKDHYKKQVRKN